VEKQTPKPKFKTLFKQSENLKSLPENQIITIIGTKLNNFADLLGLNSFGSDGRLIQRLQPILQHSDPNQIAKTTLIKGSEIFKDVAILSGKCSSCQTHYFADHENYPQVTGPWRQVYLNNAKYLKVGKSLHVDQLFSNAVVNGTYSFHASVSAYAEFWTNSYGKQRSLKIERRQIWQAFVHETVCTIAQASGAMFETNDNPSIDDLTHDAFAILGEGGAMRLSDKHTCSECTQECKAVADFLPAANDASAVPQLAAAEQQNLAESDDLMDVDIGNQPAMVNMVVMDGIIMGPTHCAFDNCTRPLSNAHGKGESFCQTHEREFRNC